MKVSLANALQILMCLFFLFNMHTSFAGTDLTLTYSGDLTYSGAADALKVGEQIGSLWVGTGTNKRMCTSGYTKTAILAPVTAPTGLTTTIDGVSYSVFETGIQGIGWVMGLKDTNASNYTPLLPTSTQWYPASGTTTVGSTNIGGSAKITFIKTATHLTTGVSTIPAQAIAQITCYSAAGAIQDTAYIRITAKGVSVTATGCSVTTPTSTTIDLGAYNSSNFPTVGSYSDSKSYTVTLSCDSGVALKATVSDQTDTSNTTNIVSLTSASTASGLGVQVLYNGSSTPLSLGPDNSSSGNTNQFDILTTTSSNQIVSPTFDFRYVRTGTITAGTANAIVGLTFSYQ